MNVTTLIIQLISGAIGGNAASAAKDTGSERSAIPLPARWAAASAGRS